MGPKKEKKKKKSKAEVEEERLAREAEEARLAEEREKLAAEQREQERLAEERRKEARKSERAAELELLANEINEEEGNLPRPGSPRLCLERGRGGAAAARVRRSRTLGGGGLSPERRARVGGADAAAPRPRRGYRVEQTPAAATRIFSGADAGGRDADIERSKTRRRGRGYSQRNARRANSPRRPATPRLGA